MVITVSLRKQSDGKKEIPTWTRRKRLAEPTTLLQGDPSSAMVPLSAHKVNITDDELF